MPVPGPDISMSLAASLVVAFATGCASLPAETSTSLAAAADLPETLRVSLLALEVVTENRDEDALDRLRPPARGRELQRVADEMLAAGAITLITRLEVVLDRGQIGRARNGMQVSREVHPGAARLSEEIGSILEIALRPPVPSGSKGRGPAGQDAEQLGAQLSWEYYRASGERRNLTTNCTISVGGGLLVSTMRDEKAEVFLLLFCDEVTP